MSNYEIPKNKPFGMVVPDEVIRHVEGEEAVKAKHAAMEKPVTINMDLKEKKNYLVLFEIIKDDSENERNFEFFTGTREDLYWYLKNYMGECNEAGIDVMKSKLLVEGAKFKFKNAPSIYTFMKDTLTRGIADDPHSDIDEYYYEESKDDEEEEE